jgi:CBS-domain-containing membrane protein
LTVYSIASALVRFRKSWKAYVAQSAIAGATTFLILLFLNFEDAVVIAALGASAFIVFGRPFDLTAKPRNVIGGHMIGFVVGSLCALLPQPSAMAAISWYALSVGLSIFLMVVAYMQHPPAAATALGVAMSGYSMQMLIAVVTITLMLAAVHFALKPRLRNLF